MLMPGSVNLFLLVSTRQASDPAVEVQTQPVPPPRQRVKRQELLAYDAAALCSEVGGAEVSFEELRAAHRCCSCAVLQ